MQMFAHVHHKPTSSRTPRAMPAGFTLAELLVSVGIAVLLIYGITQVFRISSGTIGAGQAVTAISRDTRATQSVFYRDLKRSEIATGPFLFVASERRATFRNAADAVADADYDPTADAGAREAATLTVDLDVDGDTADEAETIRPAMYGVRNHRTDMLGFFAHDLQRSERASAAALFPAFASRSSWVWYGHVNVPGNDGTFRAPGVETARTNSRNFYAADWVLGRVTLGFAPRDAQGRVVDRNGNQLTVIDRRNSSDHPLLLAAGSVASGETRGAFRAIERSRYDVLATTPQEMDVELRRAMAMDPDFDWWSGLLYRFNCDPIVPRPYTSDGIALAAPQLTAGCSQFVVEFAGDFVTQATDVWTYGTTAYPANTHPNGVSGPDGKITFHDRDGARYGQVLSAVPDGKLDFCMVEAVGTPGRRYESTRWYGLPRDTNEDGRIPTFRDDAAVTAASLQDTLPVRDVVRTGFWSDLLPAADRPALRDYTGASFERRLPPPPALGGSDRPGDYTGTGGMPATATYVAAWGASDLRPMMIRVVVSYEDSLQRLGEPRTFEYVVEPGW